MFESMLFDSATNVPTETLLEVLDILDLPHNGTMDGITEATQEAFFQRKPDGSPKEWWELDEKYPERKRQLIPYLRKLGMIDKVLPSGQRCDYILLHGTLASLIHSRLRFLTNLWRDGLLADNIVCLTGARPRDHKEESKEVLERTCFPMLRKDWNPPDILPETEFSIMLMCVNQPGLPLSLRRDPKWWWVNAPGLRPTTADTVRCWLKSHKPKPGTCLAISNQPHVGYQHTVLRAELPSGFSVETVGPAADVKLPLASFLGELAHWIYQERELRRRIAA